MVVLAGTPGGAYQANVLQSRWQVRMVHLLSQSWARWDEVGKFAQMLDDEMGHLRMCLLDDRVEPMRY